MGTDRNESGHHDGNSKPWTVGSGRYLSESHRQYPYWFCMLHRIRDRLFPSLALHQKRNALCHLRSWLYAPVRTDYSRSCLSRTAIYAVASHADKRNICVTSLIGVGLGFS